MGKTFFKFGAGLILASFVLVEAWQQQDIQQYSEEFTMEDVESLTRGESSSTSSCKWKRIDCDGLFTGDYEACLVSGDGNTCSCGKVTRDC